MPRQDLKTKNTRLVHIRIPEALHKHLRVRVAEQDTSIQEWMVNLIKQALRKR